MVSEKIIIALIIAAILLSVISVAVTVSNLNIKSIPKIEPTETVLPDVESGQVSIVINPPAGK